MRASSTGICALLYQQGVDLVIIDLVTEILRNVGQERRMQLANSVDHALFDELQKIIDVIQLERD
jgi:hypothetical protein